MVPMLKVISMATEKLPDSKPPAITERDALAFAYESEEVTHFLEQGPLLEKVVTKVYPADFPRLEKEYPTLFPQDIYQYPYQFQVFAITFIRGKLSLPGHAKMKVYVEMAGRRVLKIFATS